MRTIMLAAALTMTACGHDNKDDAPATQLPADKQNTNTSTATSLAVADATQLPTCDDAHNLQLVYLLAEKQFQTCQTGSWQVIEVGTTTAGNATRLHNTLTAIKAGQTLETMIPEAREYILTLGTKTANADDSYTYKISNDPMTNGVLDCTQYFTYFVHFKADDTFENVADNCN